MSAANILLRISAEDLSAAGFAGLASSLRMLSYGLSGLKQQLGNTGFTLGQFVGAAVGAGAAFGLFLTATESATSQSADLQYALTQMNIAISDGTQYSTQLAQAVIDIGNNSVFTHTQVAETFTSLGEMGFTAENILNGVGQAAVNMSIAMGIDGPQGAHLLGQAMQEYNADASQAAYFSDVLTRSFYDSGAGADGLGQGLAAVGGMAHAMGINFTDLMTTLDLMSRSMGSGSKAGTSLRYMLAALQNPTAKEADELDRLGIVTINQTAPALNQLTEMVDGASAAALRANGTWDGTVQGLENIYTAGQAAGKIPLDVSFQDWAVSSGILNDKLFDSSGHFLGLKNAIDAIITGLKGMSPQQIQEVMDSLFNVRGGQGAEQMVSLLGQFDPKYQQIYNDLQKTGTAQKDANDLLDTAKGRWQQLGTTMNSFMAQVGGPINTVLAGIYGGINNVVSAASNSQPVKDFFSIFLPMGAVLAGVAVGFLLVSAAIALGLGPVLLPFLVVFGALVLLAGLLAGALTIIKTGFQDASDKASVLGQMFAPIKQFFLWAWNWITTNLKPAWDSLNITWGQTKDILFIIVFVILSPLIALLLLLATAALAVVAAFTLLVMFAAWLKQKLTELALWLAEHWADFSSWAVKAVTNIEATWNSMPLAVQSAWAWMAKLIRAEEIGLAGNIASWAYDIYLNVVSTFTNMYVQVAAKINQEKQVIQGFLDWMTTGVATTTESIVKAWDAFWDGLSKKVSDTLGAIQKQVSNFEDWWRQHFGGIEQWLPNPSLQTDATNQYNQFGQNLATAFANGLLSGQGQVSNASASLAQAVQNNLGFMSPTKEGPGSTSDLWAPNFIRMFVRGLNDGIGPVMSAAFNLARAMQQGLGVNAQGVALAGGGQLQAAQLAAQTAGAYGQQGNVTIPIYVGSKEVAKVVLDTVKHQLQMSGAARLGR